MRVQRDRAVTNNRRLKRGKSTHEALENEHRPERLIVRTNTPEERFGLRLVQLITGFNEIIVRGKTRELPVFGVIHGYPVLGVIDEVVKIGVSDIKEQTSDVNGHKASQSGSPVRKRQRTSSPSSSDRAASNPSVSISSNVHSTPQTDVPQLPHISTQDPYALRLIDYKTRRAEYLPPEEDSLAPKLQLMLYHRMLTALLNPETIDFEDLWRFMELDPTRPFSPEFVHGVRWEDSTSTEELHMDLHYLVSAWVSVVQEQKVEMGRLQGVNAELQLIYRRALDPDNSVEINEPLRALALQDEPEVTRAITEKLRQFGKDGVDDADTIAREVVQRIRATYPPECSPSVWSQAINSGPEQEDVHLAWAIQESLLSCAELARKASTPSNKSVIDGNIPRGTSGPLEANRHDAAQDMSRMSPIIGARTFRMDDDQLDTSLQDILQWWLGGRPAKGVPVTHSYRCFTCEFQNPCEWREEKAKETDVALEQKRLAKISHEF